MPIQIWASLLLIISFNSHHSTVEAVYGYGESGAGSDSDESGGYSAEDGGYGGGGGYGYGHGGRYGGGGGYGYGQSGRYGQSRGYGYGQNGGYGQGHGSRYGGYGPMPGQQYAGPMPYQGGFVGQGWPPMGVPLWPQPPPAAAFGAPQYRQPQMPQMPPMMPPAAGQPPAFPLPPPQTCYPFACPPPGPPSPPGQPPTGPPSPPGVTPSPGQTSTAAAGGGTTNAGGNGQTGAATTAAPGTAAQTGTTAAISASTISSSQGALSAAQRVAVLNVHNDLRSTLARGTAQNQTGTMPTGTNIIQLVYDTGLEATAQNWSQQCTFQHSDASVRNNAGENLFWTSNLTVPFDEVLVEASNFWWKELVDFGIQSSLVLSVAEFNKGIGHWSQMAWCSTAHLGCGVNVCSNATYVVCHYSPAGNIIDQVVYKQGTSCGDCPADYGTQCNATTSLCTAP